jgi:hypothetical protein
MKTVSRMKQNICDHCKLPSTIIKWKSNSQIGYQVCLVMNCEFNWEHDHKLCQKCKINLDKMNESLKSCYIPRKSNRNINN